MLAGLRLQWRGNKRQIRTLIIRRLAALAAGTGAPGAAGGEGRPLREVEASDGSAPDDDTTAFEAFFREHERAVYACLWRLTGDAQTARDLTQETFLRAWREFAKISAYERPLAWLLRVATNLALTQRRSARVHPVTVSSDTLGDAEAPAHSDPTIPLAEADQVQRTLLDLPSNQRAALILREVYGLSCEEIGAMLGISRAAVKMALLRGREGFRRRYLGRETGDE